MAWGNVRSYFPAAWEVSCVRTGDFPDYYLITVGQRGDEDDPLAACSIFRVERLEDLTSDAILMYAKKLDRSLTALECSRERVPA